MEREAVSVGAGLHPGQGGERAVSTLSGEVRADDLRPAGLCRLSWKIYGGVGKPSQEHGSSGYGWTICPTFYECLGSAQYDNLVPGDDVLTDASNGDLPSYSIVTPTANKSQHAPWSMTMGDNWIGQVVGSFENGPDRSSTAIFITYDDCGCFFDHVNPLQYDPNWGVRVPMVIVSPFAKAGSTDSTPATFLSMLAFAEHTFGLRPLNSEDAAAYDLRGVRLLPGSPGVGADGEDADPASERAWLARLPINESDPT